MIQPLPNWNSAQTWGTFEDGGYRRFYEGLELQKSSEDLDRYRAAVQESGAEVIIETGTRYGASALFFHLDLGLEVVSIDIGPQFIAAIGAPHDGPGIIWVIGSSTSSESFEIARRASEGKRTMVSLDSDHHSAHVQAEIRLFSTLVTPGCHLAIEDACFDLWEGDRSRRGGPQIPEIGGPLDAIRAVDLEHDERFERAVDIEGRWPISHSPCGWWKRRG